MRKRPRRDAVLLILEPTQPRLQLLERIVINALAVIADARRPGGDRLPDRRYLARVVSHCPSLALMPRDGGFLAYDDGRGSRSPHQRSVSPRSGRRRGSGAADAAIAESLAFAVPAERSTPPAEAPCLTDADRIGVLWTAARLRTPDVLGFVLVEDHHSSPVLGSHSPPLGNAGPVRRSPSTGLAGGD